MVAMHLKSIQIVPVSTYPVQLHLKSPEWAPLKLFHPRGTREMETVFKEVWWEERASLGNH